MKETSKCRQVLITNLVTLTKADRIKWERDKKNSDQWNVKIEDLSFSFRSGFLRENDSIIANHHITPDLEDVIIEQHCRFCNNKIVKHFTSEETGITEKDLKAFQELFQTVLTFL